MSKGIRKAVYDKFLELAPKRVAGEFGPTDKTVAEGNVKFRRAVCDFAVETFGISLQSAGSAYNVAFQQCKVDFPDLVVNLGRAEDKKGGRKPGQKNAANNSTDDAPIVRTKYNVVKVKNGEIVQEDLTELEAQQYIAENGHPKVGKPKLEMVSQAVTTEVVEA